MVQRPTGFREQREAGRTEEGRMMMKRTMRRRYRWMRTCSREKIWRSLTRNSTHWRWKTERERVRGREREVEVRTD